VHAVYRFCRFGCRGGAERERGYGGSLSDEPSFLYNATAGRIQEFLVCRDSSTVSCHLSLGYVCMLRIGNTGDAVSAIMSYRSISKREDCNKPSHQGRIQLQALWEANNGVKPQPLLEAQSSSSCGRCSRDENVRLPSLRLCPPRSCLMKHQHSTHTVAALIVSVLRVINGPRCDSFCVFACYSEVPLRL
jgi:hypothetical protein